MDGGRQFHRPAHDDDGFRIRGAALQSTSNHTSVDTPSPRNPEPCTICLEPVTERAVAVPCNHLTFDFLCLASWLQERAACPLCNCKVSEVQYDFRGPQDFKRFQVAHDLDSTKQNESSSTAAQRPPSSRISHTRHRSVRSRSVTGHNGEASALERRKDVHRRKLFSLRVGANRVSRHRDFGAQDFAQSPELQSRARMFLRRELQVFTFLDANPRGGNRDFLIEYIVALLKLNDLKSANGEVENLLQEFLGRRNTPLLLHELQAWLRSPYTSLDAWDRHVQYGDA